MKDNVIISVVVENILFTPHNIIKILKQGHQNEHSDDIKICFSALFVKYRTGTDSFENHFKDMIYVFFLLLP